MSSYSRQQLESWLKTIDVKADKVLDIGGSQLPIKGRIKSWDVKECKILDIEEPHECKVKPDIVWDLNNPSITIDEEEVSMEYCWKIDETLAKYRNDFDTAFCIEVSEYWYNPFEALKNINFFLKKGGILYLSTHFIYPVHNPVECDYLRYTRAGIIKLLEESGFKIDEIEARKIKSCWLLDWFEAEKMKFAKRYNKHNEIGHLIKAVKI